LPEYAVPHGENAEQGRSLMWKVLSHGITHVGRERKNNEDAFRIASDAGLFLVCDGMGGHASGEVASQIAADTMVRFVALDRHRPEFRWPTEVSHTEPEEARALDAAVRVANGAVFAGALANQAHKGMGTTVVGVLMGDNGLSLVHVGDSRIYRLRAEEFEQLTEDHSLLNHYMRSRPMSADQIRQFVGKNVIVRAVGLRDVVEPDVQLQDYCAGDVYLLCSDGLTDMVPDEVLAKELHAGRDDLPAVAQRLVDLALEGGGRDNITLVVLRIVEVPDEWHKHGRETLPLGVIDTTPGFDTRQNDAGGRADTLPGKPRVSRPMARTQETVRPSSDISPARDSPPVPAPAQAMPQRPGWDRSTGRMRRVSPEQVAQSKHGTGLVVGQPTGTDPNEITAPVVGQPFGARAASAPPDSRSEEDDTTPITGVPAVTVPAVTVPAVTEPAATEPRNAEAGDESAAGKAR